MLDFQLFRIKVYLPKMKSLFYEDLTPSQFLKEVILLKPSAELRKNFFWHIGNVSPIGNSGLYFRIGKTTKVKMEIFQNGNFLDEEFENAPYTHVILDYNIEVAAIAKKTKLSNKPIGIANQLVKLLNETEFAAINQIKFDISDIIDPSDFIYYLQTSTNITKFWVTFTRPNAFDKADFYKPLQEALREVNGEKGKAILQGDSLDSEPLKELARSAAATGDDAGAVLQRHEGEKYEQKYLRKNAATFQYEDIVEKEDKAVLLKIIRNKYNDIREG
jgi:hypothetical protein